MFSPKTEKGKNVLTFIQHCTRAIMIATMQIKIKGMKIGKGEEKPSLQL